MSQLFFPVKRTTLHIPDTGPLRDPGRGHLHILINNPCENGLNLLVPLNTFYPNCDGTCVLVGGHPFITKKSFILYAKADTVETKKIMGCVQNGFLNYEGLFNEDEFKNICDGFNKSPHIVPRIKSYYNAYCI